MAIMIEGCAVADGGHSFCTACYTSEGSDDLWGKAF